MIDWKSKKILEEKKNKPKPGLLEFAKHLGNVY